MNRSMYHSSFGSIFLAPSLTSVPRQQTYTPSSSAVALVKSAPLPIAFSNIFIDWELRERVRVIPTISLYFRVVSRKLGSCICANTFSLSSFIARCCSRLSKSCSKLMMIEISLFFPKYSDGYSSSHLLLLQAVRQSLFFTVVSSYVTTNHPLALETCVVILSTLIAHLHQLLMIQSDKRLLATSCQFCEWKSVEVGSRRRKGSRKKSVPFQGEGGTKKRDGLDRHARQFASWFTLLRIFEKVSRVFFIVIPLFCVLWQKRRKKTRDVKHQSTRGVNRRDRCELYYLAL